MYKLLLPFLLLVALAGCGVVEHKGAPDEALENELKTKFQNDLNKIGKRIDFGGVKFYFFTDVEIRAGGTRVEGFCSSNYFEKAISIYKDFIPARMYRNFVHEIGHCYYNLGHDSKSAIMNGTQSLEVLNAFDHNEDAKLEYIKEMFN